VVGVLGLLGVAAIVGLVAFISNKAGEAEREAKKTCEGFSYVGRQDLDHCARPGDSVEANGLTVTASALERDTDEFEEGVLCTDVTFRNRSDEAERLGTTDWDLQRPDGAIATANFASEIEASSIAAGASTEGRICFEDRGRADEGDYLILWEPFGIRARRGVWVGPVGG